MSKEEKREEERIRNNLKRRASLDRKRLKKLLNGSGIWRDTLLSQRKMHLICYLESEMDRLLFMTIWHLRLTTLENVLENGKFLQSFMILLLRYLYQSNANAKTGFISATSVGGGGGGGVHTT